MLKVVKTVGFLMFSLCDISRFLLGPLGVILVNFGGLWESPRSTLDTLWSAWAPFGSLWASCGLLLGPLAPFAVPLGLLWSYFGTLALLVGSFWTASGPF